MELERIERENIKIAQKIYELKPYLQVNELEEQFREQRRYGQSIRKIVKKKVLGPKILPPIDEARSNISKSVIVLGDNKGVVEEGKEHPLSQSLIQVKAVTKAESGEAEIAVPQEKAKEVNAPIAENKNAQEKPKDEVKNESTTQKT
jgi:hypothetical protein